MRASVSTSDKLPCDAELAHCVVEQGRHRSVLQERIDGFVDHALEVDRHDQLTAELVLQCGLNERSQRLAPTMRVCRIDGSQPGRQRRDFRSGYLRSWRLSTEGSGIGRPLGTCRGTSPSLNALSQNRDCLGKRCRPLNHDLFCAIGGHLLCNTLCDASPHLLHLPAKWGAQALTPT